MLCRAMGTNILLVPNSKRITDNLDVLGQGIDHRYVVGREVATAL